MRPYCAVYVDVGYLLGAAATRVAGTSLRSSVVISYPDLIARIIEQAERESGLPVLRLHWYDSGSKPGGSPDSTQEMIGMLPRVKLRLGRLSPRGEQKGVDLRIGLDLASHGRNRVSDLIYLVSGDDDLTEAVEEAQNHGVQVVILAVPDAKGQPYAVSRHLIREADDIVVVEPGTIDGTVTIRTQVPEAEPVRPVEAPGAGTAGAGPATGAPGDGKTARPGASGIPTPAIFAGTRPLAPGPPPRSDSDLVYSVHSNGSPSHRDEPSPHVMTLIDEVCRGVVTAWLSQVSEAERQRVIRQQPFIPNDLDRTLLIDLAARMGIYDIDEVTRYELRAHFWEVMG